jgi:hypothetical protein
VVVAVLLILLLELVVLEAEEMVDMNQVEYQEQSTQVVEAEVVNHLLMLVVLEEKELLY